MKYYYIDKNNQSAGPASLDEIRALAAAGTIAADPQVVPEGGSEWKLLSTIPAPAAVAPVAAATAPKLDAYSTILSNIVDKALGVAGGLLDASRLNCALRFSRQYGHYALLGGTTLVLLFSIYASIRLGSIGPFLLGVGCVVGLAVGQFVAVQFLGAGDKLIASTPSRLSSNAVLKCVGLICIVAAAGVFLISIGLCIETKSIVPIVPALVFTIILAAYGSLSLNPSSVNVEIGQGSAGEEAVGLIMTFLKMYLKIVPIIFALLSAAGAIITLVAFFAHQEVMQSMSTLMPAPLNQLVGAGGAPLLIMACFAPLAAYLNFLIASLLLDVLRAILVLPSKIDSLRG